LGVSIGKNWGGGGGSRVPSKEKITLTVSPEGVVRNTHNQGGQGANDDFLWFSRPKKWGGQKGKNASIDLGGTGAQPKDSDKGEIKYQELQGGGENNTHRSCKEKCLE